MKNYKEFYRQVGTRLISNFINPKLLMGNTFIFPKDSVLLYVTPSDILKTITRSDGLVFMTKKPRVLTPLEYAEHGTIGTFKQKSISESAIIARLKKEERGFKYLSVKAKKLQIPTNELLIFNYGAIGTAYKYISHPLADYYKWYNTLLTATTHTRLVSSRHKFIYLKLPTTLPDYAKIIINLGPEKRRTLDVFRTADQLNILEIFRFMSDEFCKYSILNTIPDERRENTTLLLDVNGNIITINLNLLYSMLKGRPKTTIAQYGPKTISKLLYVFFNKVLEATPHTPETLGNINESAMNIDLSSIVDIDNNEVAVDTLVSDVVANDIASASGEVNDVTDEGLTQSENLKNKIGGLTDAKIVSKNVGKRLVNILEEQETKMSPYGDELLKDMLTIAPEDIVVSEKDKEITPTPVVLDSTMLKDTLSPLNKNYIQNVHEKALLQMMYGIQNTGHLIEEHSVEHNENILGKTETHKLKIRSIKGGATTSSIIVPVLEDDGTFRLSGSTYRMRKQRGDLPIRKISNTRVGLTSYFGKLSVTKATFKKDDYGYWLQREILNLSKISKDLSSVVHIPSINKDVKLPRDYGYFSRYMTGFVFKDTRYNFDYSKRKELTNGVELKELEKDGVVVGLKGKYPVIMRYDNELFYYRDSVFVSLGTLTDVLGITLDKAPIESISVKVFKENIPVVVLLSYYKGFTNLLKHLGTKYAKLTPQKIDITSTQFKLVFKDYIYVIDRDYGVSDIIVSGFNVLHKKIATINSTDLDSRNNFSSLYAVMELPSLYVNEISLIGDMFIDGVTKTILENYNLPTKITDVFIESGRMLLDDNFNSNEGVILKGYERLSGMVYSELVGSIRTTVNKSHFSKSKVEINPYGVLKRVMGDSTVVLQDDLNPIAELKQEYDVTYLGANGRSEETMSESTRSISVSEIGVTSEATKDSGAVGISSYMVANPKLSNSLGMIDQYDIDKDGWSSTVSNSAMLSPFGLHDDPKRLMFADIMQSHIIPIANARVPYVLTGYEAVIGSKTSPKFVTTAEGDGEVISVSNKQVIVKYKDKTLGKVTYPVTNWTTKEESGICYTNRLVSNVSKGNKVKRDHVLLYANTYFEPSIHDPTRVIYRTSDLVTVGFFEDPQTYEDSVSISTKLHKRLSTTATMVVSKTYTNTKRLTDLVEVGSKINVGDPLYTIYDTEAMLSDDLDKRTLEILKDNATYIPKSDYNGVVSKVVIYYNSEYKNLSKSIRKYVDISDKELVANTGYTGLVDRSYSIKGIPLGEDMVEIKVYIDTVVDMGRADKLIIGNQLKGTVGETTTGTMIALDGTEILATTATRSFKARIIGSPGLIGTTSMVLEKLKDKAVEEYFN